MDVLYCMPVVVIKFLPTTVSSAADPQQLMSADEWKASGDGPEARLSFTHRDDSVRIRRLTTDQPCRASPQLDGLPAYVLRTLVGWGKSSLGMA